MKKILILNIFLISVLIGKTQTTYQCGTAESDTTADQQLPWFGNNQYLRNFLDSLGYYGNSQSRIIGSFQAAYHVPIKFWIHRNTNSTGGPTEGQVQALMTDLNSFYNTQNRTLIGFYMKCSVSFIDDDNKMNLTDAQAALEGNSLKESGAVNVHIINSFSTPTTLGVYYVLAPDAVFIAARAYTGGFPDVLAHEIGHLLGLLHTHEHNTSGKCRKEAIDRNRTWPFVRPCFPTISLLTNTRVCETTGDLLDDTPADPLLISNNSCTYGLTGLTDPWGDSYTTPPSGSQQPDTRLIMSYNFRQDCINRFSDLQIAVMLHCLVRGKYQSYKDAWATRSTYDEYEPDNSPAMGNERQITLGQTQERNFHQQFDNPGWSMCDVDWVSFTPTCSGTYNVETSYQFGGTVSPDTRLTLFAANGTTQLAQNDNKSATDKFSSVSFAFVAGTRYLIRIENLNAAIAQGNNFYYNLGIGTATVTGVDNVCGNQVFTLSTPNATSVVWTLSPSPTSFVNLLNPNSSAVTVRQVSGGSGNVTLTATFNALPCIVGGSAIKNLHIGLNAPTFSMFAANGYCQGQQYQVIGSSIGNGTVSYNWYINGVLNSFHGSKLISNFPTNNTRIELEVTNATCGTSDKVKQDFICGQSLMTLAPNPATSTVKVEAIGSQTFTEIRVVNKFGVVSKVFKYSGKIKSATIDLSQLPKDIYSIQLYDGVSLQSKMLSVQ